MIMSAPTSQKRQRTGVLLERCIAQKILPTFYAISQVYISSSCDSNNMRVFVERLECYWVVNLPSRLARIIEVNEVVWIEGFPRDGICVVMLSV